MISKKLIFIALSLFIGYFQSSSQTPKRYTPSEIYHAIEKLNFLGSALYVAAHPDDENTYVISYLSNEAKARTAYLSLTRGDGGQNLIGSEIKELLGVIRTQELLAARRIDGGEQMFTRANDFGYSKNSEETLATWNRDEVLSDVVWAIRKFRPDIVINRFSHQSSGKTHGHHSASAELSYEAFDLAGRTDKYPDQLSLVEPHQPRRLFFNTSYWFYGRDRKKFEAMDKSDMVKVDVGVYYDHMGMSNNELAAYSRSQHVCQGMGRTPSRGSNIEYLQILKGDMPENDKDPFDGINTTWSRVKNGEAIGKAIDQVLLSFDFRKPETSLPELAKIYTSIASIKDEQWRSVKLQEVENIISAIAGLFIEANPRSNTIVPGERLEVKFEMVNRSSGDISIDKIDLPSFERDTVLNISLLNNKKTSFSLFADAPRTIESTDPYWLREKGTLGMYAVEDQSLIGLPETNRSIEAKFHLDIHGEKVVITKPLIYKSTDRERGEVYSPFEVTKELFVKVDNPVYIFPDQAAKIISVSIKSGKDSVSGSLSFPLSEGWEVNPEAHDFQLSKKGEEQTFDFLVLPPEKASDTWAKPIVSSDGKKYSKELIKIEYNHVPAQMVIRDAETRLVKLDIKTNGDKIAYIAGAGDEVASSLREIGYTVDMIEVDEISAEKLKPYDAVVLGIRAYNKHKDLQFKQKVLFDYVSNGGTLLTQYMVTWGLNAEEIAPFPMKLSRERVSVEEAEVRILAKDHPMLNTPNIISSKDFEGWVQERGLYFPNEWSEDFIPLLSSNDPGESPKDGGLLVAKYGEGYFIYSGYSWFRQLPAGVPGAYRIFANLVSQGHQTRP